MKRTMAIATFLIAGASALGAGANPLHLRGSDTLFTMITDVLNQPNCGGGSDELHYSGGGSGNASVQMKAQQQEVGPMSSFLAAGPTSDTCTHATAGANAEGIIWALDGLSMVAKKTDVGSCGAADGLGEMKSTGSITVYDMNEDVDGTPGNGAIDCPAGVTCSPSYALTTGATAWRDVLEVLYYGVHNEDRGTTSGLDGKKMCNSDLRYTLAGTITPADPAASPAPPAGYNAWSQNFEGGCTSGSCTRIEHLWRRGDDSGTTDTFTSLVCGSFSDQDCQFCNGVIDSNLKNDDGVDFDPIRRTCRQSGAAGANPAAANKRVCSTYKPQTLTGCPNLAGQTSLSCGSATATQAEKDRRWSLGLVQPIVPPENLIASETYPTVACVSPKIRRAPQVPPGFPTTPSRCPCGEPIVGGACTVTADAANNAGCFYSGFVVPSGSGACSPKVFNNEIRHADGSVALDPANKQYLAAAYRMRTGFASGNCTAPDATEQIGCLTAALSCTLGFAGREACDPTNPSNDCLEIQGVEPTNDNVRAGTYKISRSLFLNSMYGFENVKTVTLGTQALDNTFDPDGAGPLVAAGARTQVQLDAQVNLAGCLSNETLTESIITGHGFVTLYDPANYAGRGGTDARCVRCRDYNTAGATNCNTANTDSCTNNGSVTTANGASLPSEASDVQTGAGIVCD